VSMDIANENKQRFFFGHSESIVCFSFNNDGSLIVSGQEGQNPMIRIWDYDSGKCVCIIQCEMAALKCVSFSPDSNFLATAGKDHNN